MKKVFIVCCIWSMHISAMDLLFTDNNSLSICNDLVKKTEECIDCTNEHPTKESLIGIKNTLLILRTTLINDIEKNQIFAKLMIESIYQLKEQSSLAHSQYNIPS